jgi:hypothetical protein
VRKRGKRAQRRRRREPENTFSRTAKDPLPQDVLIESIIMKLLRKPKMLE